MRHGATRANERKNREEQIPIRHDASEMEWFAVFHSMLSVENANYVNNRHDEGQKIVRVGEIETPSSVEQIFPFEWVQDIAQERWENVCHRKIDVRVKMLVRFDTIGKFPIELRFAIFNCGAVHIIRPDCRADHVQCKRNPGHLESGKHKMLTDDDDIFEP